MAPCSTIRRPGQWPASRWRSGSRPALGVSAGSVSASDPLPVCVKQVTGDKSPLGGSAADAALLDELADLIERAPSWSHIVVDQAQDLSPMQCRAIARRSTGGPSTVLGDLAQGTSPWARAAGSTVELRGRRPFQRRYSPQKLMRSLIAPSGLRLHAALPYGERLPFYALSTRLPAWADRLRRPVDTALTAALLRPVPLHARTASAILLWLRKPPA
jgi:hypothetical protein